MKRQKPCRAQSGASNLLSPELHQPDTTANTITGNITAEKHTDYHSAAIQWRLKASSLLTEAPVALIVIDGTNNKASLSHAGDG